MLALLHFSKTYGNPIPGGQDWYILKRVKKRLKND